MKMTRHTNPSASVPDTDSSLIPEADTDDLSKSRGRGRPPVPESEQRKHPITCRLTDAESDAVDAARGAVSRGEYIRLAALSAPPRIVPAINREAWLELLEVGASVNQIAKILNERGDVKYKDAFKTLYDMIKNLRRELMTSKTEASEDESKG